MRPNRAVVIAMLSFLLLVAAGCGRQADPGAEEGGGAFPVSIPNVYCETVVTAQPKRVVTIGFQEHDVLLGLGIVPVGVKQFHARFAKGVGPWAASRLGDAKPKVFPWTSGEFDVGAIAKLKPDLIVGTHAMVTEDQYETFSKMAPTLVRPKQYADFGVPYDVQATMIGKAVGKEKEAKALVAEAERSFAEAREAHPEFEGRTAAVVLPDPKTGGVWAFASTDPRGEFLRSLGFTVPQEVDEAAGRTFSAQLSAERLELVGDVDLLVIVENQDPMPAYAKSRLLDHLPVAKRGHVMREHLDLSLAVSYNTVLSIPYTVDHLVPRMADTLKG